MKTAGEQDAAVGWVRRPGVHRKRTIREDYAIRIGARSAEPLYREHDSEGWTPAEPKGIRSPDRVLRAAILERAVLDAEWEDQDAIRWIHGLSQSPPTFSCEDICDVLGIPVERVRAMVPGPRPQVGEDAGAAVGRSLACGPDRD